MELSEEAHAALEEITAFIAQRDGVDRAARWFRKMEAGKAALETMPRGFVEVGEHRGRRLHSKLVMNHRIYYFIDDAAALVTIIDIVHTRRESRLEEYREKE
ncbi:MAG: type II toxin-antitoxin system RelE/ParE family toxin [Gemmatimonadota bacterium]|nr:type II toxin-antitoxin system RelE/ParE family toxin [Gemmatimonadota bacterium]MDE2865274.1 type II toxin-antitoxin system RelE/ParE family toxin [Gemmatimonadota bacterium]